MCIAINTNPTMRERENEVCKRSKSKNLRQAGDNGQERGLGQEVVVVKQPADPRAQLLKRRDRWRLGGALHHLRHAHRRTGLHSLVLLPHRLEQGPHEQPHHALIAITMTRVLEVQPRERANGVATSVPDAGVVILEALGDVGDDLG